MPEDIDNFSITLLDVAEYSSWNEFVYNSPQGTFFNTTQWAEILTAVFNRKYQILVCHKNNRLVGGSLFFINKKFNIRMITPVALYPYSGPLMYHPVDEKPQKTISNQLQIVNRILSFFKQYYAFFIFDTSFLIPDTRAFQWANCTVEPMYNYIINLNDKNSLMLGYNQSVRKKIKQAQDLNPEVIESDDFTTFVDQYINSYKRRHMVPLIAKKDLQHFLERALKLQQLKLFYIRLNNKITSGRVILIDNKTVYDLLAGGIDDRGVGATYLLHHVIQNIATKYQYLDFLGAAHAQIEQFKRGFGGELVHGFRITSPLKFPISTLLKFRTYFLQRRRVL
jgi:hypothetical protein